MTSYLRTCILSVCFLSITLKQFALCENKPCNRIEQQIGDHIYYGMWCIHISQNRSALIIVWTNFNETNFCSFTDHNLKLIPSNGIYILGNYWDWLLFNQYLKKMLSAIITFIYILVSNCGSETGFSLTRHSTFGGIQLTQVFGWKCISAYEFMLYPLKYYW